MRPLGIYAWFGYNLSLEQSLRRIQAAGFDRVMLWWGEFDGDIPLQKQPDLARKMGLEVDNAHMPFENCNTLWLPGSDGDRFIDHLVRSTAACAASGIDTLVVHLTDGAQPPPYCSLGIERLRRAADAARRCGVTLALENLRHPVYLYSALNNLTGKEIGFCYDSGHALVECPSADSFSGDNLLITYANRLKTLHLHDNDGQHDLHHLPYDGVRDWGALAARLYTASYEGAIMLEVQADEYYEERMDADSFLHHAWQAADRFRKTIDTNTGLPLER